METVKEMVSSREPSEEASNRMECSVETIVAEVAVVAIVAEIITTSRVILEGCSQVCQVVTAEEEAVVAGECTKVTITRPKVARTSKAISKIKITTIRPSNANSLKAAEIALMGISAPLPMDPLNYR